MLVVTDTGPLMSFALVGELDLLGRRLSAHVSWTTAVHEEIERNARMLSARDPVKSDALAEILKADWLPTPVDLSTLGLSADVFRVRHALAAAGDHPRAHLGEAEAIVYAQHQGNATVLTEDQQAANRAAFHGLHVTRTTDLLSEMNAFGDADSTRLWTIYEQLSNMGRLPKGWRPTDLFR